ncbi:phage tail terminator-like protein [Pseudomonas putida]|uniref:phage tail terminator-like protein n=1 Tax=Pseudomonas putida TaxID=303 RepID=UPI002B242411|nr:phage tail terminator-like protein [Pseudomonas putida]
MTYSEIYDAIILRMRAFAGIEQSRIYYPNAQLQAKDKDTSGVFKPPATGLWCRLHIGHATAFMAGMADQPYTRKPGIITVQCFARLQTGIGSLNQLADALEAHFAYWSSGDLECLEASQIDTGEYEGYYQINVNVRFRAG